jgi:hypothetical protein
VAGTGQVFCAAAWPPDSAVATGVDFATRMVAARRCPTLGLLALMIFVMRAAGTVTSHPDAS